MPDSILSNRRAVLTVFSRPAGLLSHMVRMVMAEKNIANVDVQFLRPGDGNTDLTSLNLDPRADLPVLIDRDLVLSDARTMAEYIDERFPHPPLMPIDPTERARTRQFIAVIRAELYGQAEIIEHGSPAKAKKARDYLRTTLTGLNGSLEKGKFFFGDELSLVDCAMVPILWRLQYLNVELPASAGNIIDYAERLFQRESTRASLTELEREMRPDAFI